MFNYGNANEAQKEAISATDGLVLITAGPGTGKTFTLVKRAVYLIQECGIKPEQIMMATFTEKAAKELITRITNELAERNISVNVNEMYIGTFHSLCLRIIKENLEFTRLKRNYRLLDTFDQKYLVFRNFHKFKNIEGIDELLSKGGSWKRSDEICTYINHLSEEMVDIEALQSDDNPGIRTLGRVLSVYQEMLEEGNLIDFSTIQTECYKLLMQNKQILEELQDKLQYLMIDEYQDTNYIQEQIVFLLGAKHHNICVVGDDDQGLYRFRGATIRNILEFPHKFENEGCKIIPLVVNYRSNSDIVDFYNEWISTTSGHKFKFSWDRYRYQKKIEPHVKSDIQSPAVVKLFSKDDEDEWHEKILGFIKELKESGKLTDYNQLAFLFSSVKHQRVTALANFLERNGINVYSPRSDMFFKRDEIKLALGCLMLMFPKYVMKLEKQEFDFLQVEHYRYYRECIVAANEYVTRADNKELLQFIRKHGKVHAGLTGTTDYAYSGLLYKLFMFRPFSDILDTDMSVGVVDIRPTRNLALLTQIIGKFEYLHRVDVFNGSYIDRNTELLFNLYLKLLYDGGISEYEDEAEYAPSGCVSFLTIHQSKGMEFPIVLVDSLSNVPRKTYKDLMTEVEEKYFHRPAFEPYDQTKYFDFWRLYYTAFSRAQNLLVLTCDENKRTPSQYFRKYNIIYIIPTDELFIKWKNDEAFIDEYGRLMNRKPHRVLKELKHYVADSVVQKSCASPIKDLVRDKMVEYSKYVIDRAGDDFFYEVIPTVWHKHIVPLWNGAKDVLFSKELKIDQIKCETEHKVVENQPILSEIMTKEEVDAEKRKLLYHWIGLLSSLTKLQNAGELDVESTLAQLTEPMMIERVNALLRENPNLLETDKYILLHSLLGRDLYMEGQLIPIRAAEIKKVAKNNGGF